MTDRKDVFEGDKTFLPGIDIDLPLSDFGAFGVGPAETFVQVGMKRRVLQLSRHFKTRLVRI